MQKPHTSSNIASALPFDVIYNALIAVIEANIEDYPIFLADAQNEYKQSSLIIKDRLEQEDDITIPFGRFFRNLNSDFDFESQSKTPESNATTDIGVIARKYSKHRVICFIEAKRLPTPKGKKREESEYVCYKDNSKSGGIERFKAEKHAGKEKLPFSIMLGYIQEKTSQYWLEKINGWIDEQIVNKSNNSINWTTDDRLHPVTCFIKNKIYKFTSTHSRKTLNNIELLHYWIDLT